MIKVTRIRASNDEELEKELEGLVGRIVSVRPGGDDWYQVIQEI